MSGERPAGLSSNTPTPRTSASIRGPPDDLYGGRQPVLGLTAGHREGRGTDWADRIREPDQLVAQLEVADADWRGHDRLRWGEDDVNAPQELRDPVPVAGVGQLSFGHRGGKKSSSAASLSMNDFSDQRRRNDAQPKHLDRNRSSHGDRGDRRGRSDRLGRRWRGRRLLTRALPREVRDEMTDQEAREFVEMLAVPEAAEPPPCPICGCRHPLETSCAH